MALLSLSLLFFFVWVLLAVLMMMIFFILGGEGGKVCVRFMGFEPPFCKLDGGGWYN